MKLRASASRQTVGHGETAMIIQVVDMDRLYMTEAEAEELAKKLNFIFSIWPPETYPPN